MTWKKGQSGNPSGRPTGKLNKYAMGKAQQVAESGELPIDFLVKTYRDESLDMKLRVEAARSALPFLHPRLSATEVDLSQRETTIEEMSDEELYAIIDGGKSA